MDGKKEQNIETLLQEQISYQKRIAKDLHSLYFLVIASIIIGIILAIYVIIYWYFKLIRKTNYFVNFINFSK